MGSNVSAILLAAGLSQRMGIKKQLLPVQGRPAVVRCLESLRDSQVADVVIVVNPEGGDIVNATKEFLVKVAVNELPGSDMAASVKAGMACIDNDATGIMICLCDHPVVRPETLGAMISSHSRKPDAIIIPIYRGRKGHPTLFPRFILEDIGKLATLRDVIRQHFTKISLLDVDDEGVILDMDTPEDYVRIRDRSGS
jgi:CTP:molybdopterin cytidylyltransferase MocA